MAEPSEPVTNAQFPQVGPAPDKGEPTPPATIESLLEDTKQGFIMVGLSAVNQLQILLEELKETDPPPWEEGLLTDALMFGLSVATAGLGVKAAQYVLTEMTAQGPKQIGGEAMAEMVKVSIEGALNFGLESGKASIASSNRSNGSVTAFIAAQGEAAISHCENAGSLFNRSGRQKIKTLEQAKACAAAVTGSHRQDLGRQFKDAARDAWLVQLAHAEFGTRRVPGEAIDTTDMTPTEDRWDEVVAGTRSTEKWVDAPSGPAWMNDGRGMLNCAVKLPSINFPSMLGTPTVTYCNLDGVNSTTRGAYVGKRLSEMNIPRHIEAYPESDPDFIVSVDELGNIGVFPGEDERTWLAARTTVANPAAYGENEFARAVRGLKLLLEDLVPHRIDE